MTTPRTGDEEMVHETIWLQPWCAGCDKNAWGSDGRQWCQDDPWGDCEECGRKAVKYTRALPPESKGEMVKPTLMDPISGTQRISSEESRGAEILRHADTLHDLGFAGGWRAATAQCADIALAIDSGRGNEKEIAKAITALGNLSAEPVASDDASKLGGAVTVMGEREVVWLREIDAGTDSACWVVCNKIDPGAVSFSPTSTEAG